MQALPIDELLPEIAAHVRRTSRLVVEAPPGAGKSSRVPRHLLPQIGPEQTLWVSEPRRLAARLLAHRVASELGQTPGQDVGYAVRFERRVGPGTRLIYATTGVLLRELLGRGSASLPAHIGGVVIDEIHERSAESDLLLALLRGAALKDPSFRLVVMSATLDAEPIAELLSEGHALPCPRVRSQGRSYELRVMHQTAPDDRPLEKRVVSAVRHHIQSGPAGHVLVFLPGAREIRAAREALGALQAQAGFDLLDLHGDLELSQQNQAVAPSDTRKVVLSTNVAESSVTVPGTTGVVDSGLARVARYSPWTGLSSLTVSPISRASAEQRAGRAGRTADGLVQRLYTAGDLATRPAFDTPEIVRCDLAQLVLELAAAGLRSEQLRWLSAPPAAGLDEATRLLRWLGALDADANITGLGQRMHRLPLSPRLARAALEAVDLGVGRTGALAVALLSERDILLRPKFSGQALSARGIDAAGDSDVCERVERFEEARRARFAAHSCHSLGLASAAVRSVARAEQQVAHALSSAKLSLRDDCAESEVDGRLSRALLSGFPDRVAGRRRARQGISRELSFFSGQTGRLSERSVVHHAPLLLALDVAPANQPGAGEVTIACRLEEDWLLESFPDFFTDRDELFFNAETQRVERIARIYYGSVCIDERRARATPGAAAARVLRDWVLARGLTSLDPADRLGDLAARIALLLEQFPDLAVPGCYAAVNEPHTRETLLELSLGDALSLDDVRGSAAGEPTKRDIDLEALAQQRLPAPLVSALYRDAPTELRLPGGRRLAVQYAGGSGPWAQSFLQDFFGSSESPQICQGRVALTLHLLAPNRRAIQVTQDLAGFWRRAYPELRRQLSRRYPRHPWPEDGATATPPEPRPPRATRKHK